ncbi:thiamine biosynthetic bifunctional enzyme [Nadsonia fulvescens var. elongata DSM 6958]|uniref:Thiamine biosynthetic bifunctional enzyme n=1 Tax=Nadsonia fulvescens var. elongata DSM 6958 TaxID=857566 RepID=A0A1E3PP80_9ASCO|nr:thiamine biosynthetic bifunctional enzyme [Nadsonia fulvescens var. elongata DSM 6958]
MQSIDYSVYLVTDSTMIPEGHTLLQQVEQAIENGATIIQLREKEEDTKTFIQKAEKIHAMTKKAGIPLIINDRVDVVLAIDAEGLHIGQDDMNAKKARELIGTDKILGISVGTPEEARKAILDEVDYVGIGAAFSTKTKKLRRTPQGVSGIREILKVLRDDTPKGANKIKAVAIGGINHSNVQHVLFSAAVPGRALDGVAIVSCIMASKTPGEATKTLVELVKSQGPWVSNQADLDFININDDTYEENIRSLGELASIVTEVSPFVHHITNNVIKNLSANATLAVGASPAMSECAEEFSDFAQIADGGLLVNMGTPSRDAVEVYRRAIVEYNKKGRPVIFDPVAVGASSARKAAAADILNAGVITVIKGNEGEITSLAGVEGAQMKGVDTIDNSSTIEDKIDIARKLALDTRSTVLMTGEIDVLVEANNSSIAGDYTASWNPRTWIFENGHEYLSKITGAGCVLGSLITAFCAANNKAFGSFESTATALLLYTIAAETAAAKESVNGPGTFVPALLDEIYKISEMSKKNDYTWLDVAKIGIVDPVVDE